VTQVALGVLVGVVAQLSTLRDLPVRELYVPVLECLRVHQLPAEIVPCSQPRQTVA